MNRKNLYLLVLFLCAAGYTWLFLNILYPNSFGSICLFRNLTCIPCPACGTSRSVLYLYTGRIIDALYANPLGFFTALSGILLPVWIIFDLLFSRNSFISFYHKCEELLRRKLWAISFGLVIASNWIWNIFKYYS